MTGLAEVGARSNYTLLDGASHPAELVATAKAFGHAGIGVCDRNSLAGAVRAHAAAKEIGLPFIVGARLVLHDGASYFAWPTDRDGYGRLTRLLSLGRMRAPKGMCQVGREDLVGHAAGHRRDGRQRAVFEAYRATDVDPSRTRFGNGATRLRLPPLRRQGYML